MTRPVADDRLGARPRTPAGPSASWRASSLSAGASKSSSRSPRRLPSGHAGSARRKPARGAMPAQRLDRERRAGHGRAQQLARPRRPRAGSIGRSRSRRRSRRRPRRAAPLETTARPCAADVLEDVLGPAQRPAGDEDDRDAGRVEPRAARRGCGPRPCRRSGPACRRGRWRPAGAASRAAQPPGRSTGSGRAITSWPSSSAPRSSVKPHLASTRMLAPLSGRTLARTVTPARSVSASSARERLGREAPAARLRDQPVADLGLAGASSAPGRRGRAEEADRAQRPCGRGRRAADPHGVALVPQRWRASRSSARG